jgi:hypothetical protein
LMRCVAFRLSRSLSPHWRRLLQRRPLRIARSLILDRFQKQSSRHAIEEYAPCFVPERHSGCAKAKYRLSRCSVRWLDDGRSAKRTEVAGRSTTLELRSLGVRNVVELSVTEGWRTLRALVAEANEGAAPLLLEPNLSWREGLALTLATCVSHPLRQGLWTSRPVSQRLRHVLHADVCFIAKVCNRARNAKHPMKRARREMQALSCCDEHRAR